MEAERVLGSKIFSAGLLALVLISLFFCLYRLKGDTGDLKTYTGQYHRAVSELQAMSPEAALAYCEEEIAAITQVQMQGKWEETEHRRLLYQELRSSYSYLLDYDDYLRRIRTDARKLQGVSLFSDPDSPAYKNTVKTASDFAAMEGVSVTPGHDRAVTEFFSDRWGDYSILILMGLVCALLLAERKEGLWSLVHAAPGGRRGLALRRIGILFAASWLGTVAILGSKILLCGGLFHGLGEWGRTLQSIPMFQNVPTPMTVGEFWLLYLAVKAMGTFWISLVLWSLLSAVANPALALGASGIALAGEYALTFLPSGSRLVMLRYVNLFSYVDYCKVFPRYLNLPVLGTLISGNDLVLWMLIPLCILFSGVVLWIAETKKPISAPNPLLSIPLAMGKRWNYALAGGGELCKLLIKRRGILLLMLLGVLVWKADPPPRPEIPWDPYIRYYQEVYTGEVTMETLQTIETAMSEAVDDNHAMGLSLVLSQARELPKGGWLLPSTPYDAVFSNNLGNYHRSTALLALLFLVLLLASVASQERQFDMMPLLRCTSGGRKKLFGKKQCLIFGISAAVWLLVYGGEMIKTVDTYGAFRGLQAPAFSILPIEWTMPLWTVLGLYYVWKLMVLIAAGELCYLLSSCCKRNRDALLLCTVTLILPAALAAVGSAVGEYLSLLLPLSAVELPMGIHGTW